jgi:hypothetical protein
MSLGEKSNKLEEEDCCADIAYTVGSYDEGPILTCRGGGIPGNEKSLYWEATDEEQRRLLDCLGQDAV